MGTFSFTNITDSNLVLKERTHRIKIKYSMHQYSIRLHNLGNWLIITMQQDKSYVLTALCYCSGAVTASISTRLVTDC